MASWGPCMKCRKRALLTQTLTGRWLCPSCHDFLLGASAGLIASPGSVGTAIATAGWYQRIKALKRQTLKRASKP